MIQQHIIDTARAKGVVIGHDGCTIPVDVSDLEEPVCTCDGSGRLPVRFGGHVIATVPCVCADG